MHQRLELLGCAKFFKPRRVVAWVFAGFFSCVASPALAQRMHITVQGATFQPLPVAVPALVLTGTRPQDARLAAEDLTNLLRNDVDFARFFSLVPVKTYLAPEKESWLSPSFVNWQSIGASGLIRGAIETKDTTLNITLRYFDVTTGKELLIRTYKGPANQIPRFVHQFLDALIEMLTGEAGIFSSRIAYVQRMPKGKAIFACDIDGRNVEKLVENRSINVLPSWDESGRQLLFTSFLAGNPDLFRLNLAAKQIRPLSQQRGLNMGASTSPDGKRIALTLSKDGNTEIYVMDADGKNLKRLTDSWGQDVSPTWSPDGKRIAFVSSRSGNPHIYVMNADGSQPKRLTFQGTYNQEPHWSPRADGSIVFTARDENLKYDIFLVHPDTAELTRLTQDQSQNESPMFSPDGYQIVFTSTRGAARHKQLWIMDVDGLNPHPILEDALDVETPTWSARQGYP